MRLFYFKLRKQEMPRKRDLCARGYRPTWEVVKLNLYGGYFLHGANHHPLTLHFLFL
eukprot:SAG11_NODE_1046_length_6042_cov_12.954400_9_plen_57_part_00